MLYREENYTYEDARYRPGPYLIRNLLPNLTFFTTNTANTLEQMKNMVARWDLCVLAGYQGNFTIPPRYSEYNFMLYPRYDTELTLRICDAIEKHQRVIFVSVPYSVTRIRLQMLLSCYFVPRYHRPAYWPLSFKWNSFYRHFSRLHSYHARNHGVLPIDHLVLPPRV